MEMDDALVPGIRHSILKLSFVLYPLNVHCAACDLLRVWTRGWCMHTLTKLCSNPIRLMTWTDWSISLALKGYIHRWSGWCSENISSQTGCRSSRSSRQSHPGRWSAGRRAAACTRCKRSTLYATAGHGSSLLQWWWAERYQQTLGG